MRSRRRRRWSARRITAPSTFPSARWACRWSARWSTGSSGWGGFGRGTGVRSLTAGGRRAKEPRLRHRQLERVAPDPVERHLRGEQLYPVARAPQLVATRDHARLRREPEAHRPDRLLRRAAFGSRDPRRRYADRRPERPPCARGHLARGLLAHGAVCGERLAPDAEHVLLRAVGVRH